MENNEIKETKVETELISEFSQELDSNDLLNYNIYRLEKQAKGQLFTKIIGLFIVILGMSAWKIISSDLTFITSIWLSISTSTS